MAKTASASVLLDPLRLAAAAGIQPDPWQRRALRSNAPRQLWNASRQSGKWLTAALLAVWTALAYSEPVLIVSPSLRQSQECFRKVLDVYRALEHPVPPLAETRLTLELGHGSRIISLPGKEQTIRGFSGVRLLICDEAARIADGLYFSMLPTLATSNGRLVALSTPAGPLGWFHQAWQATDERWHKEEVPASACPRISSDFLDEQRQIMGPALFSQEYECAFTSLDGAVFSVEDVQAAFRRNVEPWNELRDVWRGVAGGAP